MSAGSLRRILLAAAVAAAGCAASGDRLGLGSTGGSAPGESFDRANPGDVRPPRNPRCPSVAPTPGSVCDASAPLSCEYGGDEYGRNTTLASCNGGLWSLINASVPANPSACPADYDTAVSGVSCAADANLACDYDRGRCACVCRGTSVVWECRSRAGVPATSPTGQPPPVDACPAMRPRAGDLCQDLGLACSYDEVCGLAPLSFGPHLVCSSPGYWQVETITDSSCPS
jgi:hypothetical protein